MAPLGQLAAALRLVNLSVKRRSGEIISHDTMTMAPRVIHPGIMPRSEYQAVKPIQKMAFAGMGRPVKTRLFSGAVLKRARRKAPATAMSGATHATHASPPYVSTH